MTKPNKQGMPPIDPPKALIPLMNAFHSQSDKEIRALILESARAISSPESNLYLKENPFDEDDIASITALIKTLSPVDALETFYAAQVVSTHLLGMRKMASPLESDQRTGLKMLKFSNEALEQLQKKRSAGTQNITVNYLVGG